MKKRLKTGLLALVILLASALLGSVLVLHFTPKPLVKLAAWLPVEATQTQPAHFSAIEKNSQVAKDLVYSRDTPEGTLDIYRPKSVNKKLPVVLFVHGGAFFKGEKEMARYFGPTIADAGYAFVSIDYPLVPDVTIFDQVRQVNAALAFLASQKERYGLDTSRINLAGSSAGGFLALQLLTAYQDQNYAKAVQLNATAPVRIKSILLYSAIFDLSQFQGHQGNFFRKYLVDKMGWALTGVKEWRTDEALGELLALNRHVPANMPPVFITDGNYKTFTPQAKAFAAQLAQEGVPVTRLFFATDQKVGHGYQLQMDTTAGEAAVAQTLTFLEQANR